MEKNETFWPTPNQLLLLKAALSQGEPALAAWSEWEKREDLHDIDSSSHRLLPILSKNLTLHQVQDSFTDKINGVYRHTWVKNQQRFHVMKPLLKNLQEAGVKLLLLKGSAAVLTQYRDFGLRPMSDFDLLVPLEQAALAIEIAQKMGWEQTLLKMRSAKTMTPLFLETYPDTCLRSPKRELCDLHWKLVRLAPLSSQGIETDFLHAAVPLQWEGIDLWVPTATDQLIHACIHGAEFQIPPTLHWIPDAMEILKQPSLIDWTRLLDLARRHRVALCLRETFGYLVDHFQAVIPPGVLHELRQIPILPQEEEHYQKRTSIVNFTTPHISGCKANASMLWQEHSKRLSQKNLFYRLASFPLFLKNLWGLSRFYELPSHLIRLYLRVAQRDLAD